MEAERYKAVQEESDRPWLLARVGPGAVTRSVQPAEELQVMYGLARERQFLLVPLWSLDRV